MTTVHDPRETVVEKNKRTWDLKEMKHLFPAAGSRRSNARLSMVDFMPFSRDLSQEQLIGWVNPTLESRRLESRACFSLLLKPTSDLGCVFRGDTTNSNLQTMEPVSETDEEQVPEDLGKLTVVDKARTGRVRVALDLSTDHVAPSIYGEKKKTSESD